MRKASSLFNEEQKKRVARVVAEAESRTSAEIVPVVVTASGRYDRPEDLVGLWCSVAALIVVWFVFPETKAEVGSWGDPAGWLELLSLVAAVVGGFVAGIALGSRVGWLRRLCTPHTQMRDEVAARARTVFFDRRIHHTTGGTGLLIYVSLFERMAAVITDQTILDKLGQATLDELCARLTQGLRQGDATEAICQVVRESGERLASALPRSEGDVNELPDVLVTFD